MLLMRNFSMLLIG